ncbi:MAG: hypothetical protein ABIO24_08360 [Saprospiraceae bacterium]
MKKRHCFHLPAFLLAFLWLLVLTDCTLHYKENENKPAAGHVLEFGTLKPIPEAVVTLYKYEGEVFGSFSCSSLDSTHSNSEGQYAFSQTGFLANARKAGYFTDFTTEKNVLFGTEDQTDIILPPYAWLQVTIRNESGAYQITAPGPDAKSTGRSFYLSEGADSTFVIFSAGNDDYKYIFSVIPVAGGHATEDLQAFTILNKNGQSIAPSHENSAATWFKIYLPGHDTTRITITY